MTTLDPSASPHDVPLSAGDDAFLLALAGSLSDLRLGAVLSDVACVARVLRDVLDRCYEMAAPALHLTPIPTPNSARRRIWWEIGAAWALEQTTDPMSAADRGYEFRRVVAMAERERDATAGEQP